MVACEVGNAERIGDGGRGHLDEGGQDRGVAAGLQQHAAESDVIGVGVGDAAAASDEHDRYVGGAPPGAGCGDALADCRDQRRRGAEVPGVDDGRSRVRELACLDGFGDVLADVAAGPDHQGDHNSVGHVTAEDGRQGLVDGRRGQFDEAGFDTHPGEQGTNPVDEREADSGALGVAGAVTGDHQGRQVGGDRCFLGCEVGHQFIQW